MAVTVTYNGLAPWVDDTPFVSIHKEPLYIGSAKAAEVQNITLDGKITSGTLVHTVANNVLDPGRIYAGTSGAGGLQNDLNDVKNDIINLFSNCWGSLVVLDVSGNQIIGPLNPLNDGYNIFVESVDFESSQWIGAVGYSIKLKSYPSNYFDDMGIVEKADEYLISQNEDETYTITHRIQARGVNASTAGPAGNALDNAIAFVNARRGYNWTTSVLPIVSPILLSETESINRLEATYEVTETWVEDGYGIPQSIAGAGVHIRASVNVEESEFDNDFDQATINVSYKGGVNTTHAALRNEVMSDANLLVHCQKAFDPTMTKVLASLPIGGISIEEDLADKEINQKATFDTNSLFTATPNAGLIFFDYNVSLSYDNIMGITSVNVDGNLKTKGPANYREFSINDFLTNTAVSTHLYLIASAAYAHGDYKNGSNWGGGGAFLLNWDPKTINITKNVEKMSCKISATFDDEDFIPDFEEASYTMSVTAPSYIRNANPSASYNAHYALTDLGIYSRQKHTSKIELIYKENKKFPTSVSPPFGIPGTWTSVENLIQWRAWNLAWDLDSLFPQSIVPDAYMMAETQVCGKADRESLSFTRTRNYCTNNPLIGFPPDPLVGFATVFGGNVGLNVIAGGAATLPCPPPPATTTLPPLTTTQTTSGPTSTTTTGTTNPPIGGTTTNPPWCPPIDAWVATNAPYYYGARVCHAPTTGNYSVGEPVCWVCTKFCQSGTGVGLSPCPCPGEPAVTNEWIHYCPDSTNNCPEGGGQALDCCCAGPCPQCPNSDDGSGNAP